jgi:hypothetical protein
MSTSSSSAPSTSSSAPSTSSSAPTPSSAVRALSSVNIWQQPQFWPLCRYLFTLHDGQLVWAQLRPESFRLLCLHLDRKLNHYKYEKFDAVQEEFPNQLLRDTFFLVIRAVRGPKTNEEFHGAESPEFLKALYRIYIHLLTVCPMPLFGHLPNK